MYKFYLALWGKVVGVVLTYLPLAWDIVWFGMRNNEKIKICGWGAVSVALGGILILVSWMCDNDLKG